MKISLTNSKKRKRLKKVLVSLLLGMCITGTCSGCATMIEDTGISYIDATTDVSKLSDDTINAITKNVVNSMTLNEKVGQMFVVDLYSLNGSNKTLKNKKLTAKLKKQLKRYPVGGVVLYSRDIKTAKQTKRLIMELQNQSKASLLVCVDEEGGRVSRVADNTEMKATKFPSMFEIGTTKNAQNAFEVGSTIGNELKELGFNVNFAPVADVLKDESGLLSSVRQVSNVKDNALLETLLNEEIGDRSFGTDAELVGKMVAQEVKGMQQEGVCATLKHFPGQGAATSDTHVSVANVEKSIEQLRNCDFLPFSEGIEAGAQFVMMSQESLSGITGETEPACMSRLVVKDILREELAFKGIVITDAMNMKSITEQYSSEEAAVNCVKAGVDIILMPEDIEAAYNGIIDAVYSGEIEEKQIDKSVKRIIKCKIKNKILPLTSDLVVSASQSSYEEYQNIGDLEN